MSLIFTYPERPLYCTVYIGGVLVRWSFEIVYRTFYEVRGELSIQNSPILFQNSMEHLPNKWFLDPMYLREGPLNYLIRFSIWS